MEISNNKSEYPINRKSDFESIKLDKQIIIKNNFNRSIQTLEAEAGLNQKKRSLRKKKSINKLIRKEEKSAKEKF